MSMDISTNQNPELEGPIRPGDGGSFAQIRFWDAYGNKDAGCFLKEVHILTLERGFSAIAKHHLPSFCRNVFQTEWFSKNLPEPSNFTSRWWSNFTSIIYPISKKPPVSSPNPMAPLAPHGTTWHPVGHPTAILEHPWTPPPEVLPVHEVQDIYTWHTLLR